MSKTFKKIISLVLVAITTMSFLLVGMTAFGEDLVAVNAINFPDADFRKVISEQFDTNNDGFLDAGERSTEKSKIFDLAGILEDDYDSMMISSIEGIEIFENIETLHCGGIGLEELDLTNLTGLKYLFCGGNELTALDASPCVNLVYLNCSGGELESVTLPNTSSLVALHCYANALETLDISMLPALQELRCHSNELTCLDVSHNSQLSILQCSNNHIASLDLSATAITTDKTTSVMIGNQEVEVIANVEKNRCVIPYSTYGLTIDNYLYSTLDDYHDGFNYGFDGSKFYSKDLESIREGIDYISSTNKADAPELNVHIKTAYQIEFYYDEDYTDLVGYAFAFPGESAIAPELEWMPKCKALDTWSESIDNVQGDMSVYAIWKDAHEYTSLALEDDLDTLDIECKCKEMNGTYSFKSLINAQPSDERYIEIVDVNDDGYINAKDYALIYNDYKANI